MPRPKQIDLTKVRTLLRLGQQIHVAPDAEARKKFLLEGLCILVNGSTAVAVVTRFRPPARQPFIVSTVIFPPAMLASPGRAAGASPDIDGPPTSRTKLSRRRTSSAASGRSLATLRTDVQLSEEDAVASVQIRRKGAAFSLHDRRLVGLVHREMRWIYENDVLLTSAAAAGLSERQRKTLELLLAGDSEKQISAKLQLSHNTIHHYVKGIYRHYVVNTRSELLARIFGSSRGRGPEAEETSP